ncbi:MAG: VanZ family protein [Lachnospiraceae bacterium]|nr:VanZ family protein [Lachnospiraceae bacterium]
MKKNRHRKHGFVLLILYLVLLTYYLFFAEAMGRTPGSRGEYSYNLVLFKEIRRFIMHRDILGYRAVVLNIFGNVLAFMPFGFILPEVWDQLNRWHIITILGFLFSLLVETAQLISRVGSFDVDDLLLNTIGALIGYFAFVIVKGVWNRCRGTNRE